MDGHANCMFPSPRIFFPKHNKPFGSSLNNIFQKRKDRTLNVIMDEFQHHSNSPLRVIKYQN